MAQGRMAVFQHHIDGRGGQVGKILLRQLLQGGDHGIAAALLHRLTVGPEFSESAVGIHDHAHCTVETLQQYLDDPAKYAWEVILPKKYGASWDEKGLSVWKKP